MAHAKVVHWYREEVKGTGKWSLKFSVKNGMSLPLNPQDPSDCASASRNLDFAIGYMARPLFLGLQVPQTVLSTLGSKAPHYSAAELEYIRGTCDFFALDIYSGTYVTPDHGGIDMCAKNSSNPAFPRCIIALEARDGWNVGTQSNSGTYVSPFPKFMNPSPAILLFLIIRLPSICPLFSSEG